MTSAIATAPSLSQIEAWSTDHLESAAAQWTRAADTWEHAFTAIHREAIAPGGTSWLGAAAEAAALRTGIDRAVVTRAADMLQDAARAARHGVDDIIAARELVLRAVGLAHTAGFLVGEDLSVRSHRVGGTPALLAARQAHAEMLAFEIRTRAEKFVAVDAEVGSRIISTIEALSAAEFDEAPRGKGAIQAVDYAPIPEAPIADPGLPGDPVGKGPGPTGAEIWSVIESCRRAIALLCTKFDPPRICDWMKEGGDPVTSPYKGTGKGVEFQLPDGSRIGQRLRGDSTGRPALDTNIAGKEYVRIHINPRGGVPNLPESPRLPPELSRSLAPTESPSARGGGVPGPVLGGGVLADNTLPHFIEPPQTKELPVIGDGRPDSEP